MTNPINDLVINTSVIKILKTDDAKFARDLAAMINTLLEDLGFPQAFAVKNPSLMALKQEAISFIANYKPVDMTTPH